MAVIAQTDTRAQIGAFALTPTVLGASDTLPYDGKKRQALILLNTTAGSLTATLDGADGTTVMIDGLGNPSVAAGLAIAVPAGELRMVILPTIRYYLQGPVTVAGAAGLKAVVIDL